MKIKILEQRATPSRWTWATYSKKRFGLGCTGNSAFFLVQCIDDDTKNPQAISDIMLLTSLRNSATALIALVEAARDAVALCDHEHVGLQKALEALGDDWK